MVRTNVSDTDSLITDPDPAFGLNTDPDSALKKEHPALQNMKFLNFLCGSFCPLGSGFTDLIKSGSETLVRTHAHCL
jgi:hypothetical protein